MVKKMSVYTGKICVYRYKHTHTYIHTQINKYIYTYTYAYTCTVHVPVFSHLGFIILIIM